MVLPRRAMPVVVLATLCLPIVLAGCVSAPGFVADWEEERAAHGPVGIPATFTARADRQHVEGEGTLERLVAPFVFDAAARSTFDRPYLFFVGEVPGVGMGILGLVGDTLSPQQGSLAGVHLADVSVDDDVAFKIQDTFGYHGPSFEWPAWAFNHSSAWVGGDASPLDPTTLRFDAAEAAFLAHANSSRITNLTFPVTVHAEGMKWHRDSRIRADEALVRFDRFGWAGDAAEVRLSPRDMPTVEDARGVFGNDATLRIQPNEVASVGDFRLTQAVTPSGLLLDAEVEVRLDQDKPQVKAGETAWIIGRYREKSFEGSAVLGNVSVTGSGAPFVRVPIDTPPWIVEQIWADVAAAGWAGAFAAVPLAIISPFILIGEAFATFFDCIFNDCPDQHPYPVWIEAGDVGRFYFAFDARDAPPGTYDVQLTLVGQNHEPVVVEARVTVA